MKQMLRLKIKSVGVLGTGVIGSSWATFYASKGFRVKMYDVDPSLCEKGHRRATDNLEDLLKQGPLSDRAFKKAVSNVTTAKNLNEAIEGVQLVQESITENYEEKQQIFKIMDAQTAPDVILASSSSGLLMTEIQKVTQHPGRCLIAHPFNPPHLIPLVELVPGKETDDSVISETKRFFQGLGKIPVVLKKEHGDAFFPYALLQRSDVCKEQGDVFFCYALIML